MLRFTETDLGRFTYCSSTGGSDGEGKGVSKKGQKEGRKEPLRG